MKPVDRNISLSGVRERSMNSNCCGSISPKKEVTIGGSPVELEPREFEILGLFASHPNVALPCVFFHNVIWPHPDMKHGIKEVIVQVESLKKKLRLEASGASCRIIEESTQRGPGYRFEILAK